MSAICAGAHFTIVAAAGSDADHGLPGVRQKVGGRPRDGHSESRETVRAAIRDHQKRIEGSVLSSRGWTLQEQLFSRRIMLFFDNTVTWECHCAVFHEAMGYKIGRSLRLQDCDERFQKDSTGFHSTSWPDLEEYARFVFDYNQRKLT